MTRSTERTGRTVAEATASALRELGITTDEAEVTVVTRGRRGLFGIFPGTPARVRVAHRQSARDRAETLLRDMLRRMDISCQLDTLERRHDLHIDVSTAGDDALLSDKGGLALASLEYMVNRILQNEDRNSQRVILSVGGHRPRVSDEPEPSRRPRGRRHGDRGTRQEAPEAVGAAAPGARSGGRRRSGRGRRRRPRARQSGGEQRGTGSQGSAGKSAPTP
ncbi:MAG: Jag N-terminal domain-containing protein [Candidatus Eisenbacteria bacterium]|nr:Jag N-terminal domain-containing protein [Candidatus Eisenbacteria bacterium]